MYFIYLLKILILRDALEFCHILNKIPMHRVQLLIYFLSYTRNLQLVNHHTIKIYLNFGLSYVNVALEA